MTGFVIIASGPTAKGFVVDPTVPTICVNRSIVLHDPDFWFTLDPSAANMELMNHRKRGVKYFCAAPDTFDIPEGVTRYERLTGNGRWSSKFGLSETPGEIHTGNSAYGALGLAYLLGAEKVYLVGVDATTEEKVTGGVCRDLTHLPELFASALPQIQIRASSNFCPEIPMLPFEEGLEWVKCQ